MITGIHHVLITVPFEGLEAARRFYCEVLRLPEVPKPAPLASMRGFWLKVGEQSVHVRAEGGGKDGKSPEHIAYQVSDLKHWRDVLAKAQVEVKESIPLPGFTRLECRDPFGNRIELIQPL